MTRVESSTARRALTASALALILIGVTGCSAQGGLGDLVHGVRSAFGGPSNVSDEGNTDIYAVRPGDCLDDAAIVEENVASLEVVDCDGAHDSEVFAVVELSDQPFPERGEFEEADDRCSDEFETYVGASWDDAETLDYSAYTPTEDGWAMGDHEATCVLFSVDAVKLLGSAAGIGTIVPETVSPAA
jgi:hypothetical protein